MSHDYEYRLVPYSSSGLYNIEQRWGSVWTGQRWELFDWIGVHKKYSSYPKDEAINVVNQIKKERNNRRKEYEEDQKRKKKETIYL